MDTTSPDYSAVSTSVAGGAPEMVYRGVMEYTGDSCTASPTNPDATEEAQKTIPVQECIASTSVACVKANGYHCFKASTGRQVCWRPGETGEKTDASVLQVRTPGTTAPTAPATPPPTGETFNNLPPSVVTTNTTGTSTTTINTTNFITAGGTEAGGSNAGEGAEGVADSDGEPGSASGGGDCAVAPACTDPKDNHTMCATLRQIWLSRCKGTDMSGGDTCQSPPVCTGNKHDCFVGQQLYVMRCGLEETPGAVAPTVGEAIAGSDEVGDATAVDVVGADKTFGEAGLDTAGWGWARTCPIIEPIEIMGQSFTFSTAAACDVLSALGTILLLLASLASMKIMMGVQY